MALAALLLALLTGACNSTLPVPTPPPIGIAPVAQPPAAVHEPLAIALPALTISEREASRTGDLATLGEIWAPESQIVDGRNTVDPLDDYRWVGREAILDRYIVAVFPQPPPALTELPDLTFDQEGDSASAINGQDRWRLIRIDGRWWLQELTYQIPR